MTLSASAFDRHSGDEFHLQLNDTSNVAEKTRSTQVSQCIVALIEGRGVASEVGIASYNAERLYA